MLINQLTDQLLPIISKDAVNKMSVLVMVANAVDAMSKNGVVMLNIALKGDGNIPEKQIAYIITKIREIKYPLRVF